MVASLLYYKGRTVRWPTTQRAFDIMRLACAPTRGQTPANLGASLAGPQWRERAVARSSNDGSADVLLQKNYQLLPSIQVLDRTKVLHGPRTQTYEKTNNS